MNIAILARNKNLYSHKRLVEEGEAKGHTMRVVNPTLCYMNIMASRPDVRYRGGEKLANFEAIIPRIGASMTFYGTAVLRQFETMGIYPLNESIAILRSRDKLRSMQLLAKRDIPLPVTAFARSPMDTEAVISIVGGAPLVIKLLEGAQGKGVILADTKASAVSIINAFKTLDANILVQEYIKESQGTDIRCFVIGDKVVASMQRTAQEGEFRANIHQGGKAKNIKLTTLERQIAVKASKSMGLRVSGVDLIRSNHGPLVLEINSSPGLRGIEEATEVNIAGKIIEYIEKNAHQYKMNVKRSG